MAIRGELFTNQVNLDNRSYYFNVKENRNGDIFLQIVESKIKDGEDDRRAIVVFADDMQKFLSGMDESLKFVDKEKKERAKLRAEKKAANSLAVELVLLDDGGFNGHAVVVPAGDIGGEKDSKPVAKKVFRRKGESRLVAEKKAEKRIHVVSKRQTSSDEY